MAGNRVQASADVCRYYENKEYLYGRDRWVDYAARDFDASQVPPEWYGVWSPPAAAQVLTAIFAGTLGSTTPWM